MYKERKETTHGEIGEIITTSSLNGHKTGVQKDNVSKRERKEKIHKSSLHPSYIKIPPIKNVLY